MSARKPTYAANEMATTAVFLKHQTWLYPMLFLHAATMLWAQIYPIERRRWISDETLNDDTVP